MKRKIVVVEDNPADAKILSIAFARIDPAIEMVILDDGARAVEYFASLPSENATKIPDLVILDLNLPHVNGFELLEYLKSDCKLKKIPALVLSGSSSQQDIERSYLAGANTYLLKPAALEDVFRLASQVISFWFQQARLPG